jgi:hypothetical protein
MGDKPGLLEDQSHTPGTERDGSEPQQIESKRKERLSSIGIGWQVTLMHNLGEDGYNLEFLHLPEAIWIFAVLGRVYAIINPILPFDTPQDRGNQR